MAKLFKSRVIEERVRKSLQKKIDDAQVKCDIGHDNLMKQSVKDVAEIYKKLEADKEALIELLVADIFGQRE